MAFAILSIFLGVLLNIFAGGVRGADVSGQYVRAVQLAESLLASVGHDVKLEPQIMNGEADEIYRWNIVIEPYTPPEPEWQPEKAALQAYQVWATVKWPSGPSERQVVLTTLRLAPATEQDRQGETGGGQ